MASVANKNILKFDKAALLKQANNISDSLRKIKNNQLNDLLNDPNKPNTVIPSSAPSPRIIPENDDYGLPPIPPQNAALMSPPPTSENPSSISSENPSSQSSRIIFIDSDSNKTVLEDTEQNFHPITGKPQA